ncbi:MAG: helix-turn-helix domain-containing protein [Bacteroidetes bacterium]|nr:helix-turn-helix domain-containing protein [Bacteroidota bacterium]
MNNKSTKQKFLNLRLSGLTLRTISETLGVSLSTVCRWNKKYSDEILKLKTVNAHNLNETLGPKIDMYLGFFEKNFQILSKELEKHNEFIMPYDKVIEHSVRVMNTLHKLISLKKLLSLPVSPSDLSDSFLNTDDEENDMLNDTSLSQTIT